MCEHNIWRLLRGKMRVAVGSDLPQIIAEIIVCLDKLISPGPCAPKQPATLLESQAVFHLVGQAGGGHVEHFCSFSKRDDRRKLQVRHFLLATFVRPASSLATITTGVTDPCHPRGLRRDHGCTAGPNPPRSGASAYRCVVCVIVFLSSLCFQME